MRYIFFLLLFVLFFSNSFAQISFKDESGTHPIKDEKLEKIVDKTFVTPQNNDLEFRLYTFPALTNNPSVFVMRLKNKTWEANYFTRKIDNSWKTEKLDSKGLDDLWSSLEKNQVLTLPDQKQLEDKMKLFKADTIAVFEDWGPMKTMITDGVGYHFELMQYSYRKRAYSYHCPSAYLQKYPNIEELYRAYAIIILVYKYLGIRLSVC